MKHACILIFIVACNLCVFCQEQLPFQNTSLPINTRIQDLLNRLTIPEKIELLQYNSEGIPRLNIPSYNWCVEGLHTVGRDGIATIFPMPIGMAATFNPQLIQEVGNCVATETRAKYYNSIKHGMTGRYVGLSIWAPNINIFRDPRWGRGSETYGEDPFLTASMGVAYIKGLQGLDSNRLKTAACMKHFAAHSGPEAIRDSFDAVVGEKDLHETYLYAFKQLADNHVAGVMGAYNRLNGVPCCSNPYLLTDVLRKDWHFKGYIVSDCGALYDIWAEHKTDTSPVSAVAHAFKSGLTMNCDGPIRKLALQAYQEKKISEQDIDSDLSYNLNIAMKLGLFTDQQDSLYKNYGLDSVHNQYHIDLAKQTAIESMVLLKNDGVLPLRFDQYRSYLIKGARAADIDVIIGNYHTINDKMVNFVEGLVKAIPDYAKVDYDRGYNDNDTVHFGSTWHSQFADIIIAFVGLSPVYEGEAGDGFLSYSKGDRKDLELPRAQIKYIAALKESMGNKPLIVVVTGGSALNVAPLLPYANALIMSWYPGEQEGPALADLLYGKANFSGRLPITFYKTINDLPSFTSYDMTNRTYRYFDKPVLYPFGYGLSYTNFDYERHTDPLPIYKPQDTIQFSIKINNAGNIAGKEVVQVYMSYPSEMQHKPIEELKYLDKVYLEAHQSKDIQIRIPVNELKKWDTHLHEWVLSSGTYSVLVGSNAQDQRIKYLLEVKTTK
ncbi:MAG: glycoside hydrolase family 3 N-terminal domain-containing protein [Phycisphaerales bacterium]|nr:glycoside hydrolase family 3 N-terminal domain-containing protein [Phycisphaerales bacterium]